MLLIVEEKPVQYRAPLYAEMERQQPGAVEVVYQSTGAVSPSSDKEFGGSFSWDIPLLSGYSHEILDHPAVFAKQLWQKISSKEVKAVLLTDFNTRISHAALMFSLLLAKDLWIRMETQDEAFHRSPLKTMVRSWVYKGLYAPFAKALFIGQLNKEHYTRHGFGPRHLHRVPYIVNDPISGFSLEEKKQRRETIRKSLGIPDKAIVVAFFGKLIPKKNPDLLLQAHAHLSEAEKARIFYLFVGSGELETSLKKHAKTLACASTFTGFINQSKIHDYYLASDILCLPSRQMGETWGLTVNEGLQAGCAVLCSEHVGSSAEFGNWERVRVCESENPSSFATKLGELMEFEPDFEWCSARMANTYSMQSAAQSYLFAITSNGVHLAPPEAPAV